jgi:hypothetical protein
MLLWSPEIPHEQTRAQTRAAAVGNQRLTTWAMMRPWGRLSPSTLVSPANFYCAIRSIFIRHPIIDAI